MPKTAVYEHHRAIFGQNNVRFSGEVAVERTVHGKSQPHAMQHGAHLDLRFGVFTLHPTHHPTSVWIHARVAVRIFMTRFAHDILLVKIRGLQAHETKWIQSAPQRFQKKISRKPLKESGIEMRGQVSKMVHPRGVEPPRPCGHKILNLACLPIPPRVHVGCRVIFLCKTR